MSSSMRSFPLLLPAQLRKVSRVRRLVKRRSKRQDLLEQRLSFPAPRLSSQREMRLVEALCACLLDDGSLPLQSWVPASVAELACEPRRSANCDGGRPVKAAPLLSVGLIELEAAAQDEEGMHFERLSREAQLRLLGRLESGQLTLSRAAGTAFLDHFMVLAAQAYLAAAFFQI